MPALKQLSKEAQLSHYCHAGARRYRTYSFLILALEGGEWSVSRLVALYPQERAHGTHWKEGWVGLRAGLATNVRGKILCLCQGLNPGHPACSQTLH
jgi:hypothetical protein